MESPCFRFYQRSGYVLNFKCRIFLLSWLCVIAGCGNWGWETVESNYESELNVLAVIVVDSSLGINDSYVLVHRTLGLNEAIYTEEVDAVWYGPDSLFDYYIRFDEICNFHVENALVYLIDGDDTIQFFNNPNSYGQKDKYLDTLNLFHPLPNREYNLLVLTPDGKQVTGSVTTPAVPIIYSSQISDTLYNKAGIRIPYHRCSSDDNYRFHTSANKYYSEACGIRRSFIVPANYDTIWTSSPVICDDYDSSEADTMVIKMESLDPQYYDYFIKHGYEDEFISFVLGQEGNTGYSAGVEGGIGVFGAISSSRIKRLYLP